MLAPADRQRAPAGARRCTARSWRPNVLSTLVSNPAVWAKTALFITYDENGGFFDHVPPPTRAAGHAGRVPDRQPAARRRARRRGADRPRLPRADARGLAVRRGGLRLLGHLRPHVAAALPGDALRRRGAEPAPGGVAVTGDLTSAFNFAKVDHRCRSAAPAVADRSTGHDEQLRDQRPARPRYRLDQQPQEARADARARPTR